MVKYLEKVMNWGKVRMRESVNRGHGIQHARNVSRHMKNILDEIRSEGREGIDWITDEVIDSVAYCHDVYKSQLSDYNPKTLILEDYRSARMVSKVFPKLGEIKEGREILHAIRLHNRSVLHFIFKPHKYTTLLQLLIEADNIEVLSFRRALRSFKDTPKAFLVPSYITYGSYIIATNLIMKKSKYAKSMYKLFGSMKEGV